MITPVRGSVWKLAALCLLPLATADRAPGQDAADTDCLAAMPDEVTLLATAGPVPFPHQLHVDLELACQDCHHETLAGELQMPHPEYFEDFWIECATCHRAGSGTAMP